MRSLSLRIVPLVARCAEILGPPGLAASSASQNVVQNLPALLLGQILPKAQLGGRVFQCDATTTGDGGPGLGRRRRRRTQSQIRDKGFDLPLQGLWSDLGGTLKKKGTRSGNELRGRESLKKRSADLTFRADSAAALACPSFPKPLSAWAFLYLAFTLALSKSRAWSQSIRAALQLSLARSSLLRPP